MISIIEFLAATPINSQIPEMLIQALDSTADNQTRTVQEAVQAVRTKLQVSPRKDYWWYYERLNDVQTDNTLFDLNKKPL
jgi:hypothetical protein